MKKINCTIRFSSFSPIVPSLIRIVAVCAGLLSDPMHAAILTWSGGGGANAYWNNSANWGGAGIPGNGDTIVFQGSATNNMVNTNNIANLTLKQIRFIGNIEPGGSFDLRGNAFTLTNSIVATNTAGANTIENNITLATANVLIVVSNGISLTLEGTLSGSVGVNKAGLGTLTYQGPGNNTYTGTTLVSGGTLQLNVGGASAFGGPLVIGDGTGTGSPTVKHLQSTEISDSAPITINLTGLLNLNYFNEVISPSLTLSGGTVQTGSGTLTLSANSMIATTNGYSYIYGKLNIGTGTLTIQGNGTVVLDATVSGSANIVQNDSHTFWTSANTYTGNYTANGSGFVNLVNSLALGNTNNAMTLNGQARVAISGNVNITNQSLTVNSTYPYGAIDVYSASANSWQANFTLGSACTIDVENNCALNLNGPIGGSGGFTTIGPGTLTLSGSSANTYSGLTTVSSGTLVLNKSISDQTIPGNLVINGTLRLGAAEQIANSADMLINPSGVFDTGVNWETIDTLHGSGGVTFGVNGWIVVGGNNGSSTYDGVMSGTGYTFGGYTVAKLGSGTFTMNGNNTFTAGATHVFNGKLVINGSQPQSPVIVDAGATLGGSGTVGTITANGNGIISPGNSPGILTSSNVTFSSTGNFTVELTGPNPGVGGYDQLNVRGTVSLATATLTVIPAFTTSASIGQQFIIINNDLSDAITGTFNGMANGSLFSAGGYKFRINYAGGTGNDVVLTLWGVPGNTVTLNAVGQGWYNSAGTGETRNYSAGEDSGISNTNIYRNWFVFNVPVSSNSIIHAELLINDYYNSSPNGQETYLLRKVTTPIATLEAVGSGHVGIYNDLGTGAVYSVRSIATNEALQTAIIPLNVQFFNDATAASGGQIALGGSIATLDAVNNHNQYLFGYSLGAPGDVQLRLTYGTSVIINSANLGWYNNLGNHTASNPNYFVGDNGVNFYRNFFVFNLPALSSQFVDAELLVNSYNNVSPSGVETYQLYDVTTSITVLTNSASGATNVYTDLGSGAVYGGRNVYVSESGFIASIPLNGSFLGAALANSSGRIALGGALTSLNPAPTVENLFGASSGLPVDAQLWLGFLAAPASHPFFVGGTPTYLGNNQFQFVVSGTTGSTNEIQGSFDFQNWDFIRDLVMTNSTTSFHYTNNTVVPYRFFRAEQLQ